jgi:hypothetical protein
LFWGSGVEKNRFNLLRWRLLIKSRMMIVNNFSYMGKNNFLC